MRALALYVTGRYTYEEAFIRSGLSYTGWSSLLEVAGLDETIAGQGTTAQLGADQPRRHLNAAVAERARVQ